VVDDMLVELIVVLVNATVLANCLIEISAVVT
jgi:hypothetical protein